MNADEYLERAEQKERERLAAIPDPGKKGAAFLLYAAKEALLTVQSDGHAETADLLDIAIAVAELEGVQPEEPSRDHQDRLVRYVDAKGAQ
jgi:hypothetical protein